MSQSSFLMIMDHLRTVTNCAPHNGLNVNRLGAIFGPLLLCTNAPTLNQGDIDVSAEIVQNAKAQG